MSLPETFGYGAVALAVNDLERSLDYYQRRLGMRVLDREGGRANVGVGERPLLRLEERVGAERDPDAADLFHFALLLPSRGALSRQLRRLLATATPLTGASDHRVSEALYLRDPDGHGVELYRDRPRDAWYENGKLRLDTTRLNLDELAAASDDVGADLHPDTRIGHIHLETFDLESSKAFYVDRLGFAVTAERPGAAFMSVAGYHHHLAANTWGRKSRPAPANGHHIGMLWYEVEIPAVDGIAALADALERPAADDTLSVRDPNGLTIRFVARP